MTPTQIIEQAADNIYQHKKTHIMLTPIVFLERLGVENQKIAKPAPSGSDWDLITLLTRFFDINAKYHNFCPSNNLLREFWQSKSDACPLEATEQEAQEIEFENWMKQKVERQPDFEQATRPLIKWLNENQDPSSKILVNSTNAELLGGLKSTGDILDYVKD